MRRALAPPAPAAPVSCEKSAERRHMNYRELTSRALVVISLCLLAPGCGTGHDLTTSVTGVEAVGPPTGPAAPTPTAQTVPLPPLPPEERVVVEPLPPPQPPPPAPPPSVAAKPAPPPELVVLPPSTPPPETGPEPPAPYLLDVPFSFDQAKLRSDAIAMVEVNANRLRETPDWRLVLEGHCDEIGTTEYNLVLGEQRVHAVKEYLVGLGLPGSAIDVISYGKERPLCSDHTPECWQRNRVVHFELE
jgi:peptidoglycan-associated lipoprotein